MTLLSALPVAASDDLQIPSATSFDDEGWKGQWSLHHSPLNEVSTRDGALWISGRLRAHANLRRPLGRENVRITCETRSADAERWTPSIFVYWNASNWFQSGYRAGPIFASSPWCAVMDEGHWDEAWGSLNQDRAAFWRYDPDRCMLQPRAAVSLISPAEWRFIGVDITQKWVYFLTSKDGAHWVRYRRLLRRSNAMRSAAPVLIIGKGFADPDPTPGQDFLCNDDAGNPGDVCECAIRNIKIAALNEDLQSEQLPEFFEARDTAGEAILAEGNDPSFDSVKSLFPPLKFSREVIGVKDHPEDFAITPEAAIHFIQGYYAFEIGDPPVRFGRDGEQPAVTKRLLEGYIPVVFSAWNHEGVEYQQGAYAISDNFSADNPIRACVRLTLTNKTTNPRDIPISIRQFHDDGAAADNGVPARKWNLSLAPGESQSIDISLPHHFSKLIEVISAEAFDRERASVEEYWKNLLNSGVTIDVPEQRIVDAYRAWLAFNYLNVQKVDGRFEAHDGSGFYSMVYGISATLYCRVLDEYGRHEDAQRYLDSLLKFVKPDGSFIVNYGLPDIGAFVIALDEHYQLTRDREWLMRIAPEVKRMSSWIIDRRRADRAKQSPDAVCYGLIFEQPYCDYPQKAYNFVSDLHLAAGLYAAATSLDAAGMKGDAARAREEADAYRTDILSAMKRSAIDIDGAKVIPVFPQTHALLKASSYTALDYYCLMAGQMLEKGLLDPDGWEARSIILMMEQCGGLTLGMCRFWGGIDHAYTYGYWHNCLQRDEIRKVLLGMYASLAYGMSRDTFSAVEITHIKTGENQATLPHLYSNSQQLRLLRAMLLYEDGNDLYLCRAIPSAWLEGEKPIRVKNAATRFGNVSFEIKSDLANNQILATIDPPTATPPRRILLRLRHPAGKPIRGVTANSKTLSFSGDTVSIEEFGEPVKIRVAF
jgi:hypothetical protein